MKLDDVVLDFVEESRDDHVGLWEIVRSVREDLGVSERDEVRRLTLEVVGSLLRDHGLQAGKPSADWRGFHPWSLSTDEAIRRIEGEWLALGRDPSLWEIVWFNNPEEDER